MVVIKKVIQPDSDKDNKERDWSNPFNPEGAEDERDREMLIRQKKEAERNKKNLNRGKNNKGNNKKL